VVPDAGFNDSVIQLIENSFCQRLGENVEILVEQVTVIAKEKSGKFRYVISHVTDWAEQGFRV